ncbi:uncharacterized protein LOC132034968 [Lycium ferocissimum]|uniref:uncharacterized protein LOC132034968 n=1 Tax=Lycium ferocissimum TaxID=112874 RepID=UPI00281648E2|nr:uncharacterized protein LOC132034968 [Lycium ferocissimum]
MDLNDIFIGVRSNILLTSPLPSIGQAYALVIQDEKQREIHASPTYPGESASFLVANQGQGPGDFRRYSDKRQKSYDNKRNTPICAYCKKLVHSIDQCYKLKGFPPDFKFTKSKRVQGRVQVNNAFTNDESTTEGECSNAVTQVLTQEIVVELLQLLQQVKMGQQ